MVEIDKREEGLRELLLESLGAGGRGVGRLDGKVWFVDGGLPGDRVLAADWNDDGTDTVAIYRPDEARFYISNTNATGFAEFDFRFGARGLEPVAGMFAP